MLANAPPPPLIKGVDRESCTWVTDEVEVIYEAGAAHEVKVTYKAEQVRDSPGFLKSPGLTITGQKYPLDIDQLFHTSLSSNLWKLCYVATDKIEADDSNWGTIASIPGIYVLG